jgi:VanZ family protein
MTAAGLAIAVVAFVTLCPIALRPHLAAANAERFAAYAVLGGLVSRAAGRRALSATALVLLTAGGLEAAQALAPSRHPEVSDAIVKAIGGVVGVAAVQLSYPARRLLARLASAAKPTSDRRA